MHEIESIRISASLINLLIVHLVFVQPVHDVLSDGPREEGWLLAHDGNLLMVPARVQILDVGALEADLATRWVVETLNHLDKA